MISFETSVRIERPIEEVFAYVSDPLNFPHWNSAVEAVRKTSPGDDTGVASTYVMERTLPTGRAVNRLEIVAHEPPTAFAIRTSSGPTPFVYRYRFASDGAETVVHLDASVELPGVAAVLGPLAARGVRRGVDANFAALKHSLEARDAQSASA